MAPLVQNLIERGNGDEREMVDVMTPPITALPNGARKSAPSPSPRAIGIIPAISANVVMRMGRKRIAPASMRPHAAAPVFHAGHTCEVDQPRWRLRHDAE